MIAKAWRGPAWTLRAWNEVPARKALLRMCQRHGSTFQRSGCLKYEFPSTCAAHVLCQIRAEIYRCRSFRSAPLTESIIAIAKSSQLADANSEKINREERSQSLPSGHWQSISSLLTAHKESSRLTEPRHVRGNVFL